MLKSLPFSAPSAFLTCSTRRRSCPTCNVPCQVSGASGARAPPPDSAASTPHHTSSLFTQSSPDTRSHPNLTTLLRNIRLTGSQGNTLRRATPVNHKLRPQSVPYSSVFDSLSHDGCTWLHGTSAILRFAPVSISISHRFQTPFSMWLYASHRPSGEIAGYLASTIVTIDHPRSRSIR